MKNRISISAITGTEVDLEHRLVEDYGVLLKIVDELRQNGKKIVYTSGTYDLFHVGHARYLQAAKMCGDVLLVGIDSDELAKGKGPNRPIVPYVERSETLAHNRSVGVVFPLHDNNQTDELIKQIKPDVLILSTSTKNNDFLIKMQEKLGAFCGEIKIFEPQATTSTSARVRLLTINGAKELSKSVLNVIEEFFGKEEKLS